MMRHLYRTGQPSLCTDLGPAVHVSKARKTDCPKCRTIYRKQIKADRPTTRQHAAQLIRHHYIAYYPKHGPWVDCTCNDACLIRGILATEFNIPKLGLQRAAGVLLAEFPRNAA